MDQATYRNYIETDCWKMTRADYLKHHQKCQTCEFSDATQVHHLTYENLGREKDEDLVAVCDSCHRAFHDKGGTDRSFMRAYWVPQPDGIKKGRILKQLENK